MPSRRTALACSLALATPFSAYPQRSMRLRRRDRDSLFSILGQSVDRNCMDDMPAPLGPVKLRLPQGEEVERRIAAWSLVGDLHFLFVFATGRGDLSFATPQELAQLGISRMGPALDLALENTHREAGVPRRSEWKPGITQLASGQPELNSAYFLDRGYWSSIQAEFASPLVVAVPTRKTLLFAPLRQAEHVAVLREEAKALYVEVGRERISPGTFVFRDGIWSVLEGRN